MKEDHFFAANSSFDITHKLESVMSSNMGSTLDDSHLQHHTVTVCDNNLDDFEKYINTSTAAVEKKN